MLILQAYTTLKQLKKQNDTFHVFQDENHESILIKSSDLELSKTAVVFGHVPKNNAPEIKISEEMLEYLEKKEYIKLEHGVVSLTLEGLHFLQILGINLFLFLSHSVLLPIFVAIVTTLLMNYLFK